MEDIPKNFLINIVFLKNTDDKSGAQGEIYNLYMLYKAVLSFKFLNNKIKICFPPNYFWLFSIETLVIESNKHKNPFILRCSSTYAEYIFNHKDKLYVKFEGCFRNNKFDNSFTTKYLNNVYRGGEKIHENNIIQFYSEFPITYYITASDEYLPDMFKYLGDSAINCCVNLFDKNTITNIDDINCNFKLETAADIDERTFIDKIKKCEDYINFEEIDLDSIFSYNQEGKKHSLSSCYDKSIEISFMDYDIFTFLLIENDNIYSVCTSYRNIENCYLNKVFLECISDTNIIRTKKYVKVNALFGGSDYIFLYESFKNAIESGLQTFYVYPFIDPDTENQKIINKIIYLDEEHEETLGSCKEYQNKVYYLKICSDPEKCIITQQLFNSKIYMTDFGYLIKEKSSTDKKFDNDIISIKKYLICNGSLGVDFMYPIKHPAYPEKYIQVQGIIVGWRTFKEDDIEKLNWKVTINFYNFNNKLLQQNGLQLVTEIPSTKDLSKDSKFFSGIDCPCEYDGLELKGPYYIDLDIRS